MHLHGSGTLSLNIIHLSADYPDAFRPGKTRAISYLVDATKDDFNHLVYSLNRVTPAPGALAAALLKNPFHPKLDVMLERESDTLTSLKYSGLPGGLYLADSMEQLADEIGNDLESRGVKPDLIHGHKVTVEGLLAECLAKRFGCKFALSIQINTDKKILDLRPDLRTRYGRIFHDAELVFPFSVMGLRIFENAFGERKRKTILLPCASPEDRILKPQIAAPVIASIFHLKDYKNKNLHALINATSALEKKHPNLSFELYGGGDQKIEDLVDTLISKANTSAFHRKGPIAHKRVQDMLNTKAGFAMIPKRETFGMVFVEALLAGCPVVYPENWAIDGFFDEASFAVAVPSSDQSAITDAIQKLITDQESMKSELTLWQQAGKLDHFQRVAVNDCYKKSILSINDQRHK